MYRCAPDPAPTPAPCTRYWLCFSVGDLFMQLLCHRLVFVHILVNIYGEKLDNFCLSKYQSNVQDAPRKTTVFYSHRFATVI